LSKIKVTLLKEPLLKDPVLVCGLPGSGLVGKLAVDHLSKELNAEVFCIIHSHGFPPQVMIRPDGTIDIIKNELLYWKSKDASTDIIFYTGDSQPISPESDYQLTEEILDIVEKIGVKKVFTLAAYITGGLVKKPKIYCTATDLSAINDFRGQEVILMKEGSITGMNGILVGLAKTRGMRGYSLLGETSGYIVDANASQAVLNVFTKMLNLKIDMTSLADRARGTEAFMKSVDRLQKGQEIPTESTTKKDKELDYIS
jgi:uncharacterized protein (TIGR00162 family)